MTRPFSELAQQKPLVLINRAVDDVAAILPDVEAGVAALLAHLHDLGHRSVAYLSGPTTSWVSARRWETLLEHTERHGMALVEIGPNVPTIEGGREAHGACGLPGRPLSWPSTTSSRSA